VQRLYDLGGRRVLVTGTGPMGCVPAELALRSGNGECDLELQRAASLFNPQLVEMVRGLNQEIGAHVFIAVNAYEMHMDFVNNPRAFGKFTITGIISRKRLLNFFLCTCSNRICYIKDSLLWTRPVQWGGTLHSHFQLVSKSRSICVLGSISPI